MSSGGYLVPRIASEMGDKVAAVGDVIATSVRAVFQDCNPPAVPLALIASTTDSTNAYAGAGGDVHTQLASAPETALFFAGHDGCATRIEIALPHTDRDLDSTVSLIRFSDCREGAEAPFYRVNGSAHGVPSRAPVGLESLVASGRRNRDMETAQVLWSFFRAHQLVVGK